MRPSRLTPGTPWDVFSVFADEDITVHLALQGSRGKSTHYVKTNLGIGNHSIPASFCIAALADWDIILGEPLLRTLNAKINVANQTMTIQPKIG